jgi:hypothetical protein
MAALDDNDLKAIKDLIEVTVDEVFEKREVATKNDLSHLPTKDEFYEQTGEIIKRLDNLEEEKDVLSHRVSNHEDRIINLESKLRPTTD